MIETVWQTPSNIIADAVRMELSRTVYWHPLWNDIGNFPSGRLYEIKNQLLRSVKDQIREDLM